MDTKIAKNRYVNTKIWSDSWIRQKLNPLDRYLFIYFLTNEHTSICGIYELPIEMVAFETGLDIYDLNKSFFPRLRPKILYKNNWVIIPNFIKHQNWKSPKVLTGIIAEISQIPKEIIKFAMENGYDIDTISHLNLNSNSNSNSSQTSFLRKKDNKQTNGKILVKNDFSEKSKKLTKLMYELILKNDPGHPKPNWDIWYRDMDKINRIDKRPFDLIEKVIRWVRNDEFWMKNVLSPSKLRKQFNVLVPRVVKNGNINNEIIMDIVYIIKRWGTKDEYNWYELCLQKSIDWIPYWNNKELLVKNGKMVFSNGNLFDGNKNEIIWVAKDKLKFLGNKV